MNHIIGLPPIDDRPRTGGLISLLERVADQVHTYVGEMREELAARNMEIARMRE
jgi:hypothetical protein